MRSHLAFEVAYKTLIWASNRSRFFGTAIAIGIAGQNCLQGQFKWVPP
jgi:hypothetical protein